MEATTTNEANLKQDAERLLRVIANARQRLEEIGRIRPAFTMSDITPDRCNFPDRIIEAQVRRFRDSFDSIDVSEDCDTDDVEKWDLVAGGSTRYEVEETGDDEWCVIDTEDDRRHLVSGLTEEEAEDQAADSNREDTLERLYGFPFAQNVGYIISTHDVERFAAAGFLVWRYDDNRLIAGIDGGGYSMDGAHWAPVFFEARRGQLIDTEQGPRMVQP